MKLERYEINARKKNVADSGMFQTVYTVAQRDTCPRACLEPKLNRQGITTYSRQSSMVRQEGRMSDSDIHGKIKY